MKLKQLLPFCLLFLIFLSSCKKDELITDSSAKLEFSTDSVLFDTVFRFAGSTTKVFHIYNRHDQPINISKAYLAGGSGSAFKLNIDGISTTASMPVLNDIEILGGDSMYVFVQVFVNPSGASPLLIKDSIIFETNGNIQDVKLTAIGQDVYLHKPLPGKIYSILSSSSFSSPDTVLPVDKPHLVFGYLVVDSAHKVTIPAGGKFYMHNRSVLWVYRDGTLIVDGNLGSEVTFQGDRLEPEYADIPGQWGKIWLSPLSKNNVIDYAVIKNGGIGIQSDTVASLTTPTLHLTNTIIKNMSAAALYGQGTHIRAENCVFANCGQYVAALTIGGKYRFLNCTFANYWDRDARTTPAIAMSNYYISDAGYVLRPLDSCYFGNCIIYGDIAEEIGMDSLVAAGPGFFSYEFEYSLLKTERSIPNGLHYNNAYKNLDPVFSNIGDNNYKPVNTSVNVIDKANPLLYTPLDINANMRPFGINPDLGPYEVN